MNGDMDPDTREQIEAFHQSLVASARFYRQAIAFGLLERLVEHQRRLDDDPGAESDVIRMKVGRNPTHWDDEPVERARATRPLREPISQRPPVIIDHVPRRRWRVVSWRGRGLPARILRLRHRLTALRGPALLLLLRVVVAVAGYVADRLGCEDGAGEWALKSRGSEQQVFDGESEAR